MNVLTKKRIKTVIGFIILMNFMLFLSKPLSAQIVLNTSFENSENFILGNVNNQNNWKVTSGMGAITNDVNYVKTGVQALHLYSAGTTLQTDFIPYTSTATGLSGDVYIDFWINIKSLPTANFSITGYDLGTYTSRNFMLEFLPSGKIKLYDGSS
ncbi:MAG TPA: hypothetical protein P5157_08285, partial [Paludibacteraceae bacterium]|nr:hypothetical protein [Paludibacteraceae bacterium]